jgi:hypothetical protein
VYLTTSTRRLRLYATSQSLSISKRKDTNEQLRRSEIRCYTKSRVWRRSQACEEEGEVLEKEVISVYHSPSATRDNLINSPYGSGPQNTRHCSPCKLPSRKEMLTCTYTTRFLEYTAFGHFRNLDQNPFNWPPGLFAHRNEIVENIHCVLDNGDVKVFVWCELNIRRLKP